MLHGKGKWPVIIWWIVYHVCYNFSDLFWYIIRLRNEEKNEKKFIYFKKKKKEKKFDTHLPGTK